MTAPEDMAKKRMLDAEYDVVGEEEVTDDDLKDLKEEEKETVE